MNGGASPAVTAIATSIAFFVGAFFVKYFCSLMAQGFSQEPLGFLGELLMKVMSALIGVCVAALVQMTLRGAPFFRMTRAFAIGLIYAFVCIFIGDLVARFILELVMRLMVPLLAVGVILIGLFIMLWAVGVHVGSMVPAGIVALAVCALLAAGLFEHLAQQGGQGNLALFARLLIIYGGGFVLGTMLAWLRVFS